MYLRADRDAYERYIKGDVFNAIRAEEDLKNVGSSDSESSGIHPH